MNKMEMKATVQFYGDPAHYSVTQEREGIYNARLLAYEGPNILTPPDHIVLVRSVRKWSGSYIEQDFVDELGKAIDNRQRDGIEPSS